MTTNKDHGRSFSVFLAKLAEGDANAELTDKLQRLTKLCHMEARARNAKVGGEITLKLKLSCDPRGIAAFDWDAALKEPKPKRNGAVMFTTKEGHLLEENPRQIVMNLQDVATMQSRVDIDAAAKMEGNDQ